MGEPMGAGGNVPLDQTLWECFRYFAHRDESNAAIHLSQVRYSPLTFNLAALLDPISREWLHPDNATLLDQVLRHRDTYLLDRGRVES